MNTENKPNEENKTSNSLMRKTKSQLIDIILRKDSVERDLREELKRVNKECSGLRTEHKGCKVQLDVLKTHCQDAYDDYVSDVCDLKVKIKKYKKIIIILGAVLAGFFVLNIINYLV